ncbi:mediator of RNA polymerase II transcription subunit 15-like [Drosophila innubila]|uniref:mediator of RNA polymerase II transcription subunit 15-like n=1 Tax=Drosophila innubila TaxID=198719 RepID=UPI00148D658B|nr:mediator of RNA polymerase II transcription subunit 15-like [Drosophila innubila]
MDFSLDYRHVSDVIANYEQLSTGKETVSKLMEERSVKSQDEIKEEDTMQEQEKKRELQTEKEQQIQQDKKKEQQFEMEKQAEHEQEKTEQHMEQNAVESSSCQHEPAAADILGSWCAVCGECRDSPHGWGKLNKADQWRFDNLQNEPLANYKSTYEIRSPYVSRQISWEDTQQQQQQQQPKEQLQRQCSVVEIVTTPLSLSPPPAPAPAPAPALPLPLSADAKEWQLSRSPSPLPLRKYPAPLIDTAQRCSSPFGLNAVQARATPTPTPTPSAMEAKYTHVPQLEGHNIGLLVRTATEPLQLCMSASSSMLAATPPATPRCNSQPPPFDFLMQHGLGPQAEFQSIAASEELPQSTREFNVNRSFDNVSPRPYIGIEGACKSMCSNCDCDCDCDCDWHAPSAVCVLHSHVYLIQLTRIKRN